MTTVNEYIEAKRADRALTEKTLETREHMLRKIEKWFKDEYNKDMHELDVSDANEFFDNFLQPRWRKDTNKKIVRGEDGKFKEMVTDGMSTDTARIYFDALESFLEENMSRNEMAEQDFRDQMQDIRDSIPDSDYERKLAKNDPEIFERNELDKILDVATPKYRLIYSLMLDSGRRPQEVASIQVNRIDFDNNKIEYDILKKDKPTTSNINVDQEVMKMLQSYIDKNVEEGQKYVFATNSKKGYLTTSSMGKAFKRHAERAGVDTDDRSLKNLRHTYVTFRRRAGDTFESISNTGTHNTVNVMENSYSGQGSKEESRSGMDILRDE